MTWSLTVTPMVPWWLIAAFAAIGLLLALAGLLSRRRGALWRALAFVLLIAALIDPTLVREQRTPLRSVAAIVVDRSQSQGIGERTEVTDAAVDSLKARIAALDNVDVRVIEASRPNARDDGTALFGSLAEALSDVPPERIAGVVMVTDGIVHDTPASAAALGFRAPLHVLLTGREDERDRRLIVESAPRFGLVGQDQVINVRVVDIGVPPSAVVPITVERDGEPLASVEASPGQTVRIPVRITHGGPNIVELRAQPLEGELSDINNQAVVTIEGIRENLRVLLVSGEPNAGERTWRNLLKSDAAVDLVHFTILRPPEKQDGTPINQLSLIAFPTRELFQEKIDQFDLIIFDRYQRRGVLPTLYFDNIARYVRDGGALLVAAGPDYSGLDSIYRTPLASVLPAEPTGEETDMPFRPQVSPRGERHPVTRDLPGAASEPPAWGRWFRIIDAEPSTGETVMTGPDDKPLLQLAREGEGRVALLLSDHAWLWARGYEGGGPHTVLLRRLSHWLMKEPDLEEESLTATASEGLIHVVRQTMQDTTAPVTVTSPSGGTREITLAAAGPGLWEARLDADEVGIWRFAQGERRAIVHVGPTNPREVADLVSKPDILSPIVEETGGRIGRVAPEGRLEVPRVVAIHGNGRLAGSDWIGLRTENATTLTGVDRWPLYSGFLGLALLLGALGLAWWREGR